MWLDELDNWTHLDTRSNPGKVRTLEESLEMLEREIAKNISSNQGFWWMDLYDGWFDHPAIMERVALLKRRADEARNRPHRSVTQVLLVMDEETMYDMRVSTGLSMGLCNRVEREAKRCGAPTDLFRLKDLEELPLEQYKAIIFLNTFRVEFALWQRVSRRMSPGTLLIWHYAAGVCAPNYSLENVGRLTGFALEGASAHSRYVYEDIPLDFPPLRIQAAKDVVPLREDDGLVAARRRRQDGGVSVLAAEPCLRTPLLRELLSEAGVAFYADAPCTVYADNRITWIAHRGFVTPSENDRN